MSAEPPHPRETFDALGLEAAEDAFQKAIERGRLHHAWLLTGPDGVGKATFAYRAARRMLGAPPAPGLGRLGSPPEHPVCRQILARAHPDLLVLQRDPEDGGSRKGIPAEEARSLSEFFAKSPAASAYRVAIIDAADDLNPFGANAVLKTLEEPPERGVVLLVSRAPGGLLPTLRSRCRRLRFEPPPVAAASTWLEEKAGVAAPEALALLEMARGAPGRARRLAASGAIAVDGEARDILRTLPQSDGPAMLRLADGFRGASGAARFELLFERLAEQVRAMTTERALTGSSGEGVGGLDRWAEAWELLTRLPREVQAVNLDRGDAFFTVLARLRSIA